MNIHCQRKGDKTVTSPRQEQHNAKKAEWMEKCFECYAENGLTGTGMKALAKACGCIRNPDLRLQQLCVFGISFVDALKEFLTVLDILRVRIHLIHQPILLSVLARRPIRHLRHKPDHILRVGGGFLHKFIFNLFHTVGSGLDNQVIKVIKIQIEISGRTHRAGSVPVTKEEVQALKIIAGAAAGTAGVSLVGLLSAIGYALLKRKKLS